MLNLRDSHDCNRCYGARTGAEREHKVRKNNESRNLGQITYGQEDCIAIDLPGKFRNDGDAYIPDNY